MRHRGQAADNSPQPTESVQKSLTRLLSVSANRSCADCRSTLVDPSQVHASVSPVLETSFCHSSIPRYKNFRFNHHSFAPPGEQNLHHNIPTAYDPPIDPALVAPARIGGGGHGVFVCSLCGAAHKLLGSSIAIVHPVQDLSSWTHIEVQTLAQSGGNARSWSVFEAYMPPSWEHKRPKPESDIADRLTFIRAKYEALAFILPPPGPLAFHAWRKIVKLHPEWQGLWGADLQSLSRSDVFQTSETGSQGQLRRSTMQTTMSSSTALISRRSELPDRLVDYFCVVTASEYVDPSMLGQDLSILNSPEDVVLVPQVTDCFPLPDTHGRDQEFPEHVSTFLFPDGCRPSCMSLPPSFFTFVLTASNGDRLYGGVLRLYDESQDVEYLKLALDNSDYKGKLPDWLRTSSKMDGPPSPRRSNSSTMASDMVFLPKCLVVISHYPFFDLWRKFLLQIYRIALVDAPLPIERFIANFTCEVPLPPPGKIRVKFGFTVKDNWCVERPPENQLPLADFSFRPLFTALSIPNILIVFACLLQECRVALVCKHYGILGPVAEALTSLLFPFHWEGMYLPVLPYHMLDILDAPVPYMVGLHSRYLQRTHPNQRPQGVIFVDLDRDEVHLGFEDDTNSPRQIPCLPERQAVKLKAKLDEYASCAYVMPPSGHVATVTVGEGEQLPLVKRVSYLNITNSDTRPHTASGGLRRRDVFSSADKAYRDNELQVPITGFLSEHGQFFDQLPPTPTGTVSKSKFPRLRGLGLPRSSSFDSSDSFDHTNSNLLDREDPPGFSSTEIRGSFLRFFVSLLLDYRQYMEKDAFRAEDFIANLPLSPLSSEFVRRFLKTQMFDRFIDERRENSFDPEVKFFDESIAAKIKRSKRTALANIGRQVKAGTAFLEDNSKLVTETYTPPPPSNWGLPDDGRTYSYGTFPSLNPDLFGKVRPPRTWRNRRGSIRMSRRMSVQTAASEQVVFAKAMVPMIRSTNNLVAATRRGAKGLEQAIIALSNQFTTSATSNNAHSQGSPDRMSMISEISVPSELGMSEQFFSSAEEVVLNHRRKQSILLGIIMNLQLTCRNRYSGDDSFRTPSITNLQMVTNDSESIQATREYYAVTCVQSNVRGFLSRLYYRRAISCVSRLQAIVRGRRSRFAFTLVRAAIIRTQSACRKYLVRSSLTNMITGRLMLYRQHLVLLWNRANTSLCFRSMFWTLLRRETILQLAIVEDEIIRLWGELRMSLPSFPKGLDDPSLSNEARMHLYITLKINPTKSQEAVIKAAVNLGVTSRHYVRTLMLHEQDKTGRKPLISGSVKPLTVSVKQAGVLREMAERIQVYDRLCTTSLFAHEDRLYEFFNRFQVPLKEKRKKVMLSEIVWSEFSVADESCKLMIELFPEIKDFSDMHFRDPCKKTRGRFKACTFRPDPLEPRQRVHLLYRDRIRCDVRDVADASLRLVPSLLLRLAPLEEKRRAEKRACNRQLYLRMKNLEVQQLSDVRLSAMRDFVNYRDRHAHRSVGGAVTRSRSTAPSNVSDNTWTRQQTEKENNAVHVNKMVAFNHPPLFDLSTIHENGPAMSHTARSTTTGGSASLRAHS